MVTMTCHGPILNDNEAMASGKVLKYLPGLRDITFMSKMSAEVQISQNTIFYCISQVTRVPL